MKLTFNDITKFKIDPSLAEANHKNTKFLLFNDKSELITGPFHCKDFFNEPFHSYYHTGKDDKIYGYKWKAENNSIFEQSKFLKLVLYNNDYTFEHNELKEKVGNFIINYTTELGFKKWIRKIKMYNTHLEIDFSKQITKYPVMFSVFTYIIRTALEYGSLTEAITNDNVYYTHHSNFKKLLDYNKRTSKNLLKITRWGDFKSNTNYNSSDKRLAVHNNSGYISFIKNKTTILNNKLKINK